MLNCDRMVESPLMRRSSREDAEEEVGGSRDGECREGDAAGGWLLLCPLSAAMSALVSALVSVSVRLLGWCFFNGGIMRRLLL